MGKKIGIDLGTTYSCVSYVDENGVLKIIDNSEGEQTTPSVVFISGDEVVVGSTARAAGGEQPDNVVERVKNFMGDPNYTLNIDGQDYSPAAISKLILAKLYRDAQDALGEEIEGAIVTCPAYFGDAARDATRLAAEQAGLNVYQILDEPTAAALAYGYSRHEDMQKTILIYDLGGGTFDCTVMKLDFVGDQRKMEVITTGGDHLLGGKDWDAKLTEYAINEFCSRTGADPDEMAADPETIQYFSEQSEKVKKLLTTKASTPMMITYDGQREKIEITQEAFENATEGLLSQSIMLIDNMLNLKGLSMQNDIDEIILVGGSTRMPQVKKRLESEYGKPISSYEPDKAVAMGAALMASFANYATSTNSSDNAGYGAAAGADGGVGDISIGGATEFTDQSGTSWEVAVKCTKSYGVVVRDRTTGEQMLSNIIYKDTEKPCTQAADFSVTQKGQTGVNIQIYENNSMEETVALEEGTQIFEDTPIEFGRGAVSDDEAVHLTFIMDKDGMLNIQVALGDDAPKFATPKRLGNDTNMVGMNTKFTLM